MQSADPEKRRRFAQSPQLYLKEELSSAISENDVEQFFIETEQYSARVPDIGVSSASAVHSINGGRPRRRSA
jgi:hypothetical protein